MTFCARGRPRPASFRGLPLNIEVEAGEEKSGVGEDGRRWAHVYDVPYGEIVGTNGNDYDPVDVYVGPDEAAPLVFVVAQNRKDGRYDEDKVFLGFPSVGAAESAYDRHGPPWGRGPTMVYTFADFVKHYLPGAPTPAEDFSTRAARAAVGHTRYGSR